MKKILFITGSLSKNGTETFIMNLFRHIDRTKYMFDFLLFTESIDGYYEEAERLGAKIYRLPPRFPRYINYRKSLDKFFAMHSNEYIAIHWCGCSLTSISPVYYAYKYKIPVRIVHAHSSNTIGWHNKILHIIHKHVVARIATHFFACSEVAADYFYKNTKVESKSVLIKNGINLNLFQYNEDIRISLRTEMNLSDNLVFGHVGRFIAVKNQSFLIDIFAEIKKRRNDAVLLLIGVGEDMGRIKEKVNQLQIQNSVRFLGQCNNVNELLQVMDCFIFPSLYEGLPFTLVEAQAAGLPVYASDSVSQEAKITDFVEFISLKKSANYWADRILNKIINRVDCKQQIVDKGYSIEDTVKKVSLLYDCV